MITKQQMKHLYYKEKLSFSKMSSKTGLSVGKLHRTFHKYGLKPIKHEQWNKGLSCLNDPRILSGKNHPRWKNASKYYIAFKIKRIKLLKKETKCKSCGKVAKLLHHINKDKENNTDKNLMPLCLSCHTTMHNRERGITKYIFNCEWCGKKRTILHNRKCKQRFCSLTCKSKWFYHKTNHHLKP